MGRPKKNQSAEVDLLESESNGEVVILTPDQQKEYDNAIIRLTPGEEKVKEVQKYRELTLDKEKWFQGEQDDEMYEKIHAAIADCRGYRQTIDPDVKLINGPFKKIIKDIRDKGELIKDALLDVETYLHTQKDPIDDEKKRIADQRKADKAARFIVRNQELTKLGASFVNGFFILNDVSYSVVDIEGIDDDIYEKEILSQYKAEWQKAEDIRLAHQKIKDDAAEEARKEQEKFKEQQAELNKLLEEQKTEKLKNRGKQLELLGFVLSGSNYLFLNRIAVTKVDRETMSNEKWDEWIEKTTPELSVFKKEEQEKQSLAAQAKVRREMLSFFKLVDTSQYKEEELGKMSEADWTLLHSTIRDQNTQEEHSAWKRQEAKNNQQREIEAQKKLDESSDKIKWETVLAHLKLTPIVEMKSKRYQEKFNSVRDFLSDIEAL